MERPASKQLIVVGSLVLFFLMVPNVIVIPISFSPIEFYQFPPPGISLRWYEEFFTDPRWLGSLFLSLRVGAATAVLSVLLGVCAAFGVTRGLSFGRQATLGLVLAPIVVPNVIVAAGLYVFYADIGLLHSEFGLILAHTIIATPIVTITVMASVKRIDRNLELAAMSLGAGYVRTFITVVLPQVRPGILAGLIFAFVTSFDELVLAIFLGGIDSTTLPMKMWEGITVESNPVLPAASTVLLVFSTLPLLIVELQRRRRAAR